jgi:Flp pilus assembly protein TadB
MQPNFLLFAALVTAAATPAVDRQRNAQRRHPRFLRRMESSGPSMVRAAGVGAPPGDEQVAEERREQL